MNKKQFLSLLSEKTGLPQKEVSLVYETFVSTLVECMQNKEKVQLVGFASFDVTEVPEKKEVNPETGELTLSTAYTKPVFKFSHSIRERINS